MKTKKVTVCGCGVLGSQISWHIASYGYNVYVYEINKTAIEKGKEFHKKYSELFKKGEPLKNITYTQDIETAISGSFMIVESITESIEDKASLYEKISTYADEDVIITTNSSTIKPSQLKIFLKNPSRFLAMHFANPIWEVNIVEIMGHPETDENVFNKVVKFVESINMIPIKIFKEQRGYIINSLLIPWLAAAQHLYFTGIADYKDIDRVWMISTKSDIGPFGIMDIIGLKTIYDVNVLDAKKTGKKELIERAEKIKKEFIEKGKLGINSGEGFYKYPNPEYKNNDFLIIKNPSNHKID